MESNRLFDAIKSGDVARLRELLDANPELARARGPAGESAVLLAVYHGKSDVRDFLVSRVDSLDVFEAAAVEDADRVAQLVAADPSLANAFAPDGFTPLGLAAYFGHRPVVELLLARGANPNAISRNATGYTALTGAVARGDVEIVRLLLVRGASARHRYGPGYSSLHEAAASGNLEIARLLLDHGAAPGARTDDGQSPLDLAEAKGHSDLAALLRKAAHRG